MDLSKTALKIIIAINILLLFVAFFFLVYAHYILDNSIYAIPIIICIIILGGLLAALAAMYIRKE